MAQDTTGAAAKAREDEAALLTRHLAKLRAQQAKVNEAKAPYDEARETLTALFREAKVDGFTRKRLERLLDDTGARLRDLLEEEEQRARDNIALGLPVYGVQADLFGGASTPQETKDEFAYEADGYLAGRRADEPKPPEDVPQRFVQAWMRGYGRGQEINGQQLARADELIAARGQPNATEPPKDLNPPEPEAGTPEAAAAERKSVARARASLDALNGEPANEVAA